MFRFLTLKRTLSVVPAALLAASAAVLAVAAAVLALHASVAAQSHVSAAQLLGQRFGFTPGQLAAVDAGTPVAVVLPSSVDREIAVAGAVFVHATAARLVSVLQDVERLESGEGFIRTKRLSDPPRLADFAGFQLPAADVEALRDCRPGRCDVKLGQGAFDLLAKIDWSAPDAAARVNALARQASLDYVLAYRKGGNQELAVYLDSDRPQFIAREFEEMIGRVDLWPDVLPPLAKYLRGYPTAARPRLTSDFFYWSMAEFGLKPVFRINHVVVYGTGRTSGPLHVVAVKQLYASHYFHTALEVRAVVSDARPVRQGRLSGRIEHGAVRRPDRPVWRSRQVESQQRLSRRHRARAGGDQADGRSGTLMRGDLGQEQRRRSDGPGQEGLFHGEGFQTPAGFDPYRAGLQTA